MIKIANLTFGYKKQKLFSDLNLTLEPGNPRVLKVGKRKFLRIV